MSEVKTSEVLYEAAQLLMERDCWAQREESGYCVVEAISVASWKRPGVSYGAVTERLREFLGCPGAVWQWNDAPERTAEDVILALKQCAADLEERGE